MKLVIFGFKPIIKTINISEEIVKNLTIGEKVFLESNTEAIDTWLKSLFVETQPLKILGIGEYPDKDAQKLRLESLCTNKFKNEFADYPYKVETEINSFIKPNENLIKTRGMGSLFCNYASYQLMKLINYKKVRARYSFIHVPKSYNLTKAQEIIQKQLIERLKL